MGGPVPYIHVAADTPCTCTLTDTPYHLFQHAVRGKGTFSNAVGYRAPKVGVYGRGRRNHPAGTEITYIKKKGKTRDFKLVN